MPDRTDHDPAVPHDGTDTHAGPVGHEQLEQDVRLFLLDLGANPRDLSLTPAERDRTGRAAAAALTDLLARSAASSPLPTGAKRPAPAQTPSPQDRGRWRHRVWGLAAAVLVAVAVSVPVVRLATQQPGTTEASTPAMAEFDTSGREQAQAATAILTALSDAAAAQPAPASLPVQFVATYSWRYSPDSTALEAVPSGRYLLPNGTLRLIKQEPQPLDQDGRIGSGTDTTLLPITSNEAFPGPDAGPGYPATLSTDPGEVAMQLIPEPDKCPQTAVCLVQAIVNLHTTYVLPPALSAALWTALADTDQLESLGDTPDRLGRPSIALRVATADPGYDTMIYADPATGAFLGTDLILARSDPGQPLAPPAVVGFTVIAAAQRVSFDRVP